MAYKTKVVIGHFMLLSKCIPIEILPSTIDQSLTWCPFSDVESYCRRKKGRWFTCLLRSETNPSSRILVDNAVLFWLAEHSCTDSTMCRILVFVLLGLYLDVLIRLSVWGFRSSLSIGGVVLSAWVPVLLCLFVPSATLICWGTLFDITIVV